MKIALVVEASSGGAGRHAVDLSHELLSRGHVVHLLHGIARLDSRFRAGLDKLTDMQGFRSQPFAWEHNISRRDLSGIGSLIRYLRAQGPFDIVHGHSTKAGLLSRAAAAFCRTATVYTPHGVLSWDPTVHPLRRRAGALLESALSCITSRVIAVSDRERRHLAELGISPAKLSLVRNGVSLADYDRLPSKRAEVRARFGLDPEHVCVGFIGRLVAQKDPGLLVSAFARAASANSLMRLLIVGDGPLLDEMQRMAEAAGVQDRVLWCGAIDGAEALPAFDLLVLSSCTESLPYVVVEALAAGRPVVATNVGGVSELVEHGRNGLLVKPGDVGELASALAAVAADRELRARMGVAARNAAAAFDVAAMAMQIEIVYTEVLRRDPAFRAREARTDCAG